MEPETLLLLDNSSVLLYLGQESDVHLHAAALAGPVQPLHVHVQRPGAQYSMWHQSFKQFKTVKGHVNQRFHLSLGTWRWKCLTWEASLERTMFPVNWPGVNQNGKSGISLSWNSAWILIRKIHESEVKFCIYLRKKLTTDCQYISKCCKNGANKHLFAQNLLWFFWSIFLGPKLDNSKTRDDKTFSDYGPIGIHFKYSKYKTLSVK